jgi:hypothetical protein
MLWVAAEDCDVIAEAELRRLLRAVDLEYLVEREGGLDAVVDWGSQLSLGEQQRLGMARLFYHRPKFAILDECTSGVTVSMHASPPSLPARRPWQPLCPSCCCLWLIKFLKACTAPWVWANKHEQGRLLDKNGLTSAQVDMEERFCQMVKELGCTCVTISHRPALMAFHDIVLALDGEGGWSLHKGARGLSSEEGETGNVPGKQQ